MFEGFSPETVDFLWGIRMNNNREWFLSHKDQYLQYLYLPTKALGAALSPLLSQMPGAALKVSRIYRDARMHHPDPYKESLWISLRQESAYWSEKPCLFFDIHPEGVEYGFLLWNPPPRTMEAFRRELLAHPARFPRLLKKAQENTGAVMTQRCYHRPKPVEDPRLAACFGWRDHLCCSVQLPFSESVFSPDLGDQVLDCLRALLPLYHFFAELSV